MRKHLRVDIATDPARKKIDKTLDQRAIGGAFGFVFAVEALAGTRFGVEALQYVARAHPNDFRRDNSNAVSLTPGCDNTQERGMRLLVVSDVVALEQPARQFGSRVDARGYDDVTWLLRDLFKVHDDPLPSARLRPLLQDELRQLVLWHTTTRSNTFA